MSKRLIITIDEETGDFQLEMPDGYIASEQLIAAVDATFELIAESLLEMQNEESDESVETEIALEIDKKKLN